MDSANSKNEYARHVSLFLAELLRSRKISLERAAEIAQKVVENINLIDSEHNFLQFVKELTLDFDELFPFEERVHMHVHVGERRDLERKVRGYAVHIMPSDLNQALAILQEALKDEVQLPDLYVKFPQFKQFIDSTIHQWTKTQNL
ncbi:MAG TPA: hypothetical protein VF974_02490 [Patescibacteria group bacterium]